MKTFAIAVLAAFAAVAPLCAADGTRPSRLDITSEPAGAAATLDGKSIGTMPTTLHALKAGTHHLRLALPGYESYDAFFDIADGTYVQQDCKLVPEKGILLVVTDPEGCDISLAGVSLGQTPRLLPALALGKTYRFDLAKIGYAPKKFEVKLESRVPVVRKIELMVDSGAFEIESEPSGAEVLLNGVGRGRTPFKMGSVQKGEVKVELRLDGYRPFERMVTVRPGVTEKLDIRLEGEPAALALSCNAPGATYDLDGKRVGQGASVVLEGIIPGEHTVTVRAVGHSEKTETLTLANGSRTERSYELESEMGSLAVTTTPSGATVTVDGKTVGRTKTSGADTEKSEVLVVENLLEGEHVVVARLDGFADATRKAKIQKGRKSQANFKLKRAFIPNVKIQTVSGEVKGVYKEKNARGVVIETAPGVTRTYRQEDVKNVEWL